MATKPPTRRFFHIQNGDFPYHKLLEGTSPNGQYFNPKCLFMSLHVSSCLFTIPWNIWNVGHRLCSASSIWWSSHRMENLYNFLKIRLPVSKMGQFVVLHLSSDPSSAHLDPASGLGRRRPWRIAGMFMSLGQSLLRNGVWAYLKSNHNEQPADLGSLFRQPRLEWKWEASEQCERMVLEPRLWTTLIFVLNGPNL